MALAKEKRSMLSKTQEAEELDRKYSERTTSVKGCDGGEDGG